MLKRGNKFKDTDSAWGMVGAAQEQEGHEDDGFDPANPPPFSLSQIRAAIPTHCWVKDPWRSLSYVLRDVLGVVALGAAAVYFNSWLFWPIYWFAQGTMFWALFLIGHDTGHGSFSDSPLLNNVVGHLVHSWILVPYHGWRISHRTHHNNHGNVDKDEAWVPVAEKVYKKLDVMTRIMRFTTPFTLLVWPYYLWNGNLGKSRSHFNPYSDLFRPEERGQIIISTACWMFMASLLLYTSVTIGPAQVIKLYVVPYLIFVMWIDFVTYMHHHGHDNKLPWYRSKEWTYLRGGLTTADQDYGWISNIHHDIGTHVIHHLFPSIPHYHLVEATKAAKPVLGKYYREPEKSGPFPFHLFKTLSRSINRDHYVSDTGEILYYLSDPNVRKIF